jgi:UDP-glucose 4-epimerase
MNLAVETGLVTGGAGFIGSHLVEALADCRVRVLDDFSTGKVENLPPAGRHLEIIRGDIRNAIVVSKALRDVSVVFHLACRGVRHSIGNPWENHDVNASGTLVLLREAKRAGVNRFVHVSSSEVYGTAQTAPMDESHPTRPETVYGAAKLAGESYARAYHRTYDMETVVVRPFNNYGPRSHHEGESGEVIPRFAVWALCGWPPVIFGNGAQTRDFIFVEDTAYWLRKIAECDDAVGQTINLGTGRETSVLELARLVYQAAGAELPPPEFQQRRPGDVDRHLAGVKLAEELLGFHIRTPLEQGIGKVVDFFRHSAGGPASLLADAKPVNWAA